MEIIPARNSQLQRENTPGTIKFELKKPGVSKKMEITTVSATLFNTKSNNILHLAGKASWDW